MQARNDIREFHGGQGGFAQENAIVRATRERERKNHQLVDISNSVYGELGITPKLPAGYSNILPESFQVTSNLARVNINTDILHTVYTYDVTFDPPLNGKSARWYYFYNALQFNDDLWYMSFDGSSTIQSLVYLGEREYHLQDFYLPLEQLPQYQALLEYEQQPLEGKNESFETIVQRKMAQRHLHFEKTAFRFEGLYHNPLDPRHKDVYMGKIADDDLFQQREFLKLSSRNKDGVVMTIRPRSMYNTQEYLLKYSDIDALRANILKQQQQLGTLNPNSVTLAATTQAAIRLLNQQNHAQQQQQQQQQQKSNCGIISPTTVGGGGTTPINSSNNNNSSNSTGGTITMNNDVTRDGTAKDEQHILTTSTTALLLSHITEEQQKRHQDVKHTLQSSDGLGFITALDQILRHCLALAAVKNIDSSHYDRTTHLDLVDEKMQLLYNPNGENNNNHSNGNNNTGKIDNSQKTSHIVAKNKAAEQHRYQLISTLYNVLYQDHNNNTNGNDTYNKLKKQITFKALGREELIDLPFLMVNSTMYPLHHFKPMCDGLSHVWGSFTSLRFLETGLTLNIDVGVLPVWKPGEPLQTLLEQIGGIRHGVPYQQQNQRQQQNGNNNNNDRQRDRQYGNNNNNTGRGNNTNTSGGGGRTLAQLPESVFKKLVTLKVWTTHLPKNIKVLIQRVGPRARDVRAGVTTNRNNYLRNTGNNNNNMSTGGGQNNKITNVVTNVIFENLTLVQWYKQHFDININPDFYTYEVKYNGCYYYYPIEVLRMCGGQAYSGEYTTSIRSKILGATCQRSNLRLQHAFEQLELLNSAIDFVSTHGPAARHEQQQRYNAWLKRRLLAEEKRKQNALLYDEKQKQNNNNNNPNNKSLLSDKLITTPASIISTNPIEECYPVAPVYAAEALLLKQQQQQQDSDQKNKKENTNTTTKTPSDINNTNIVLSTTSTTTTATTTTTTVPVLAVIGEDGENNKHQQQEEQSQKILFDRYKDGSAKWAKATMSNNQQNGNTNNNPNSNNNNNNSSGSSIVIEDGQNRYNSYPFKLDMSEPPPEARLLSSKNNNGNNNNEVFPIISLPTFPKAEEDVYRGLSVQQFIQPIARQLPQPKLVFKCRPLDQSHVVTDFIEYEQLDEFHLSPFWGQFKPPTDFYFRRSANFDVTCGLQRIRPDEYIIDPQTNNIAVTPQQQEQSKIKNMAYNVYNNAYITNDYVQIDVVTFSCTTFNNNNNNNKDGTHIGTGGIFQQQHNSRNGNGSSNNGPININYNHFFKNENEIKDKFFKGVIYEAFTKGLYLNPTPEYDYQGPYDNLLDLEQWVLDLGHRSRTIQQTTGRRHQYLILGLVTQGSPHYSVIKRVGETLAGIPSQFADLVRLSKQDSDKKLKDYLDSVVIKINVKLGGLNWSLYQDQLRNPLLHPEHLSHCNVPSTKFKNTILIPTQTHTLFIPTLTQAPPGYLPQQLPEHEIPLTPVDPLKPMNNSIFQGQGGNNTNQNNTTTNNNSNNNSNTNQMLSSSTTQPPPSSQNNLSNNNRNYIPKPRMNRVVDLTNLGNNNNNHDNNINDGSLDLTRLPNNNQMQSDDNNNNNNKFTNNNNNNTQQYQQQHRPNPLDRRYVPTTNNDVVNNNGNMNTTNNNNNMNNNVPNNNNNNNPTGPRGSGFGRNARYNDNGAEQRWQQPPPPQQQNHQYNQQQQRQYPQTGNNDEYQQRGRGFSNANNTNTTSYTHNISNNNNYNNNNNTNHPYAPQNNNNIDYMDDGNNNNNNNDNMNNNKNNHPYAPQNNGFSTNNNNHGGRVYPTVNNNNNTNNANYYNNSRQYAVANNNTTGGGREYPNNNNNNNTMPRGREYPNNNNNNGNNNNTRPNNNYNNNHRNNNNSRNYNNQGPLPPPPPPPPLVPPPPPPPTSAGSAAAAVSSVADVSTITDNTISTTNTNPIIDTTLQSQQVSTIIPSSTAVAVAAAAAPPPPVVMTDIQYQQQFEMMQALTLQTQQQMALLFQHIQFQQANTPAETSAQQEHNAMLFLQQQQFQQLQLLAEQQQQQLLQMMMMMPTAAAAAATTTTTTAIPVVTGQTVLTDQNNSNVIDMTTPNVIDTTTTTGTTTTNTDTTNPFIVMNNTDGAIDLTHIGNKNDKTAAITKTIDMTAIDMTNITPTTTTTDNNNTNTTNTNNNNEILISTTLNNRLYSPKECLGFQSPGRIDIYPPIYTLDESNIATIMVIGIDVCHDFSSRSHCAFVASWNPTLTSYHNVIFQQGFREEIVPADKARDAFKTLLIAFTQKNRGYLPKHIIIYRDGLSDSQIGQCMDNEIRGLISAINILNILSTKDQNIIDPNNNSNLNNQNQNNNSENNENKYIYKPTITMLIAVKRHNVRFQPPNNITDYIREQSTQNCPSGTVIDNTIVRPDITEFYLQSHCGSLGTARPTLYQLVYTSATLISSSNNNIQPDSLFNNNNINNDNKENNTPNNISSIFLNDLQLLTYYLCFAHQRTNTATSLPIPTFYAHLLCYRGRYYNPFIGQRLLNNDPLKRIKAQGEWKYQQFPQRLMDKSFFL